jgi:hypothetical protein
MKGYFLHTYMYMNYSPFCLKCVLFKKNANKIAHDIHNILPPSLKIEQLKIKKYSPD